MSPWEIAALVWLVVIPGALVWTGIRYRRWKRGDLLPPFRRTTVVNPDQQSERESWEEFLERYREEEQNRRARQFDEERKYGDE